jgi:pimeloyl-ACP methyl ester carboxylesterase
MAQYFTVMPEIDITPWLADIKAPTLIVTGDEDPIVPPSQAHRLARNIPTATLKIIPGAGHILTVEQPGPYRDIVRRWMDRQRLTPIR